MPIPRALLLLLLAGPALTACEKNDPVGDQQLLADYQQRVREARAADSTAITKYVADSVRANNSRFTRARRLASGVVVVPVTTTTNALPEPGQTVRIAYRGTFLTTSLDSVFDRRTPEMPYPFQLGVSRVISGWHQGVATLRRGERAILLIPSGQAYGPAGQNTVPPNTPLRFDVELTAIE